MSKFIYADNAATTRISGEVLSSMMPYLDGGYGNASSIYSLGRESKKAVETAREQVAALLGAMPGEIFFTSGGSESDNWAIKVTAQEMAGQGKKHIITTAFEHHAVLNCVELLEKQGFDVTYIPVGENGVVNPQDIAAAIRPDTALVTVMYANNEIGTVQPIAEIGEICKKAGVLFHTDAVQAVGKVNIDVKAQNIDMLSLSGHKLHAPKGIGALYVRRGVKLPPFINGGGQENGKRAGTENVASIVALAKAMSIACTDIEAKEAKLMPKRDKLIDGLLTMEHSRLNGDREQRLAGNVNISFAGVEGEALLLTLDNMGICASSGSACTSGSLDPSHVLLAIGLEHEIAHGSLRLSIEEDISDEDIEYIITKTKEAVTKLRAMSPTWERILKEGK